MNKDRNRIFGFTLIEVLFLIAIIGVIISLGMLYAEKRASNIKVHKTALQMQQLLQGAINYKLEHNQWPQAGNSQSINCTGSHPDPFCSYIPAWTAMQSSPWGSYYSWVADDHFKITTVLPSTALANRVAALLPNSQVTDKTVAAYVGLPGIVRLPILATTGVMSSDIKNFTINNPCPSNMGVKIYPFRSGFDFYQYLASEAVTWISCKDMNIYSVQKNEDWTKLCQIVDVEGKEIKCPINVVDLPPSHEGFWSLCRHRMIANVAYIIVCVP